MSAPAALKIKDLHKSFGSHEVIKGISLEAQKGEVIAMNKDIKHFKRIGSGTPLSVQLTKRGQYKSAKK